MIAFVNLLSFVVDGFRKALTAKDTKVHEGKLERLPLIQI